MNYLQVVQVFVRSSSGSVSSGNQHCGGKFNVVAPGGSKFTTPSVQSTGDMQDNTATNAHAMAQMRSIYNGHTHPIVSIQTGGSTISSNPPTQPE
ncbi:hypothetical protein [Paraburkholderia sp. BL6669N2]|uniref:hypothetical protein n=1 Tax=Paraburkholderia sp. BL6669N2 TaxID=1938807 RepID=UPI0011C01952|nr:hypothetical protein [Paraburkholderia sp. BL6669N2]